MSNDLNISDPYRISRLFDNPLDRHKKCIEFNNVHIFMNWLEYNEKCLSNIKQNHRVHIFMDSLYDDSLLKFCRECHEITKRTIILHIPAFSTKGFKYAIRYHLAGFHEYKIKAERKPVNFIYEQWNWRDHRPHGISIYYSGKGDDIKRHFQSVNYSIW